MPTYTLFPLQRPTGVSQSHLTAYKNLRLTSLKADPQAFGSTYADEVVWTEDVWRKQMDSSSKRTIVVSVRYDPEDVNGDGDGDTSRDYEHDSEGEWIATATIVAPSEMPDFFLAPFRQVEVGTNWQMYGLFWMWVHPAHRGKGLATQVVNACLEWAQTHIDSAFSTDFGKGQGSGGSAEKVVILLVKEANIAGHALYSKMGFAVLEEIPPREGTLDKGKWMLARL